MSVEYNDLLDKWIYYLDFFLDLFPQGADQVANNELKHLVFDTYQFCKEILSDKQVIAREKLVLYKYIAQLSLLFSFGHRDNDLDALHVAYSDALDGLCFAIEEGFDLGSIENPLRLGSSIHIPVGCAAPEADMTSYESFEASINEYVQMLIEYYG